MKPKRVRWPVFAVAISLIALLGVTQVLAGPEKLPVLYVDKETGVNEGNDCQTFVRPCRDIEWALTQARDGDTIVIGAATYTETLTIDKNVNFEGADANDPPILDGENTRRIAFIRGVTITIEGLRFKDGYVAPNALSSELQLTEARRLTETQRLSVLEDKWPSRSGGALYIADATVTITSCEFLSNTASAYGGAVFARNTNATVINTRFQGNVAEGDALYRTYGGAWYQFGTWERAAGSFEVRNSTFDGNFASHDGGAASFWWLPTGSITIVDSAFVENACGRIYDDGGGAVRISYTGNFTISHCSFVGNSSGRHGGGLYVEYSDEYYVTNSLFANNSAGGQGGAVWTQFSQGTIEASDIFSNTAASGGGLAHIDPFDVYVRHRLVNDAIVGNRPSNILFEQKYNAGWVDMYHNTVDGAEKGVVVNGEYIELTGVNNIIVGHDVGVVVIEGTASLSYTLWNDNVLDWEGNLTTSNDVFGNPDFADPAQNDYHIGEDSDARDAGTNIGVNHDHDGNPRVGKHDIGAFEFRRPVFLPLVVRWNL